MVMRHMTSASRKIDLTVVPHPLEGLPRQVEQAVRAAEQRARELYRLDLPPATIDFSLRGRCAGQARLGREARPRLRINLQLLAENLEDFLVVTIPHEVAHLVVLWQARQRRSRPRPHGPEWQAVMRDCFALEPVRCHDYQTTPARVVRRPFIYACPCREHRLTSTMHNRIRLAGGAACRNCRKVLRFLRLDN